MISNAEFLFKEFTHNHIDSFFLLPQSGSDRKNYIGITNNKKYIITENNNIEENKSFFYFSDVFQKLKLNTPKILKISENQTTYIQEFLGDKTLFEIIKTEGESQRVKNLVQLSLKKLFDLQTKTKGKIDFSNTFEYEAYDEIPIMHDLFYFEFMFVDILDIHYHKSKLIKEFYTLSDFIKNISPKGIMIRDFQSRNILVNNNDIYFIDYQSAMNGVLLYDVISFLYQNSINFSDSFKEEMLDFYYNLWSDNNIRQQLKNHLKPILLIRSLQVLGAYGFRGLIQKKEYFINNIHKGIENLYKISSNWEQMDNFPELQSIVKKLIAYNKNLIYSFDK